MAATLLVSLSGLDVARLDDCVRLADELDIRRVPVSWLLAARPPAGRHRPDAPAISWLRERLTGADALVMHGYNHQAATGSIAGTRLGHRAEFAALPAHEAGLRLAAAVRAFGELGLGSEVFAPPRWLASRGTLVALRRGGFRVCADRARVWLLDPGPEVVLRGRTLAVGPPDGAEPLRCRTMVAGAGRSARRGQLVRVAVAGPELARPAARRAVLDAVDAALAAGAVPATYAMPVPRVPAGPAAAYATPLRHIASDALSA